MKLLPPLFLALVCVTGCMTSPRRPVPASGPHRCPPPFALHYENDAMHFTLCLPGGVTKGDPSGYAPLTVVFVDFPVPPGTNLQSKQLIITPGVDPNMQATTAMGHFRAGGVNFARVQAGEGSAGHMTTHLIYTWKRHGQSVHFDFALRAVNVDNYDPANRPAEYNLAAEVKLTEQIMSTFHKLL